MKLNRASRFTLLLILVSVVAGSALIAWQGSINPDIPFLTRHKPAEWIIYPVPPNLGLHRAVDMQAVFERSFELPSSPSAAELTLRAFTRCECELNDTPVEIPSVTNWKEPNRLDVTRYLRAGPNRMRISVTNNNGPPALWLTLSSPDLELPSDARWSASLEGAIPQPAKPAALQLEPSKGNHAYGSEITTTAFRNRGPILICFALLSACILAAARYVAPRLARLGISWDWAASQNSNALAEHHAKSIAPFSKTEKTRFTIRSRHVVALVAVLWVALFANNLRSLPVRVGFDDEHHLKYIEYIMLNRSLPLAKEGWEMFQPPLYYSVSALLLQSLGISAKSEAAVVVLRMLGCVAGLTQFAFLFGSIRLLFPDRPRCQWFGLIIAALLPTPLYLCHFVSNEMPAAALGSGAIYFTLRILRQDDSRLRPYIALGIFLGAALLTKFSSVVAVPVVLTVLAARSIHKRQTGAQTSFLNIGVAAAICLAVCGWHYVRVWKHFGNPFIGNWDPATGFVWWQDPGYRTLESFTRTGRALVAPFLSGLFSVPDGLYSTFWGDGLYGGGSAMAGRPPWNYELMAAGYLLSLLPMLAILVGFFCSIRQLVRQPKAEGFLLLGLSFSTLLPLILMTLKIPSYAQAKAFYALPALTPAIAFAAHGLDLQMRPRFMMASSLGVLISKILTLVLCAALGTWAMNSFASFWIRGQSAEAQFLLGGWRMLDNKSSDAITHFRRALRDDPNHARATIGLSTALVNLGEVSEALKLSEQLVREHPDDAECQVHLALTLVRVNQTDRAIAHLQRALELAPDHATAYFQLGAIFSLSNRSAEAEAALRQALRVSPGNADIHLALAQLLNKENRAKDAIDHFRTSLRLKPDNN